MDGLWGFNWTVQNFGAKSLKNDSGLKKFNSFTSRSSTLEFLDRPVKCEGRSFRQKTVYFESIAQFHVRIHSYRTTVWTVHFHPCWPFGLDLTQRLKKYILVEKFNLVKDLIFGVLRQVLILEFETKNRIRMSWILIIRETYVHFRLFVVASDFFKAWTSNQTPTPRSLKITASELFDKPPSALSVDTDSSIRVNFEFNLRQNHLRKWSEF